MAYILKDDQIGAYDELHDVTISGAAVTKGATLVRQDVFGFYMTAGAVGDEVTLIYRARQVLADKTTGTGEAIVSGDKVYHVVATGLITASPTGTLGTNYYYVGVAKKSAAAGDSTCLIRFDGTNYKHDTTS